MERPYFIYGRLLLAAGGEGRKVLNFVKGAGRAFTFLSGVTFYFVTLHDLAEVWPSP